MIIYAILVVALVLLYLCFYALWSAISNAYLHRLLLSLSFAVFLYHYVPWVFLSVYLKYLFAAAVLGILIVAIASGRLQKLRRGRMLTVVIELLLTFFFVVISALYYTGTVGKPYGVAYLSLPFKRGSYFVFQGGWGLPTNAFHYKLRGAVYAMDLVKLNRTGNRANKIFSTRLEDYEIYNDTIYSPCDGLILKTKVDNPDNIPPSRTRGPSNTNQVLIQADSYYVFMAHLKPHCVFVQEGDVVHTGQPLGCAGNSGFSLEPHLHIQVHARTGGNMPWYREPPMKIAFGGKSYLLFQTIPAGD